MSGHADQSAPQARRDAVRTRRGDAALAARVIAAAVAGGRTIKAEGDDAVLAVNDPATGAVLIVKLWSLGGPAARARSWLGLGRADRQWRGAARLAHAGIATARCLALARGPAGEGAPADWLIMEHLPGRTLLHHLAANDLPLDRQLALADALGAALAAMARAHLHNRDGKPSNWIVTDPDRGSLAVIDTVGVGSTSFRLGGNACVVAMLASLAIEPMGCGHPVRRALCARVVRAVVRSMPITAAAGPAAQRVAARALWRWCAARIAAHGDPTPKVNPLA